MSNNNSIKSVCPYCGVGCGIVIDVIDGKIAKVSGNKRLYAKGNTCNSDQARFCAKKI
ncbi:hypothetical protein FY115_09870 [Cellvibrio japonicus]|nr:hypothetical protein FY117_09870 [Cellvibrio japonicus]QEI16074.1 hypothetical protein FY116_09875 [Cellvibrio japonicus]QEI19652.1 hypothetical protein FY115_09870 [Cellvibrio japonicus]